MKFGGGYLFYLEQYLESDLNTDCHHSLRSKEYLGKILFLHAILVRHLSTCLHAEIRKM